MFQQVRVTGPNDRACGDGLLSCQDFTLSDGRGTQPEAQSTLMNGREMVRPKRSVRTTI